MIILDIEEPDGCNDCPLCQTVHLRNSEDGMPVMASRCFVSRQRAFYLKNGEKMEECPIMKKRNDYEELDE